MAITDWYTICIKDYLIRENIMDKKDYVEVVLNESDCTFRIDIHVIEDGKRVGLNEMKGEYEAVGGNLFMKFLNTKWKVKI